MTKQDFLFLDARSGEMSEVMNVVDGSSEMMLQVGQLGEDEVKLTVQGRADLLSDDWQPIMAVDLSHVETVVEITAAGLYFVPIGGIMQVRVSNGGTAGTVKVYGRINV